MQRRCAAVIKNNDYAVYSVFEFEEKNVDFEYCYFYAIF